MTSLEKKMMKLIISSINTNKKENGLFDLLVDAGCDPLSVKNAFDCWKIEQLGGKKPRALSAYQLWCNDNRDRVVTFLSTEVEDWDKVPQAGSKEDGVKGRMGMISGELGKRWKGVNKRIKKKYNKKHELAKLEIEEKIKTTKVDKKGKQKQKQKQKVHFEDENLDGGSGSLCGDEDENIGDELETEESI